MRGQILLMLPVFVTLTLAVYQSDHRETGGEVSLLRSLEKLAKRQSIPGTKTVCENDSLNIDCGDGKYIDIKTTDFGRRDKTTCIAGWETYLGNINCGDEQVNQKVQAAIKTRCQNKQQCSVKITNKLGGDPCYGTYKYANVRFECLAVCEPTPPSPGDRTDNDCDGLVDEEAGDGRDNDGDGLIDEDLAPLPKTTTLKPTTRKPATQKPTTREPSTKKPESMGFAPVATILPKAPAFPHKIPDFVLQQIKFAEEERRKQKESQP